MPRRRAYHPPPPGAAPHAANVLQLPLEPPALRVSATDDPIAGALARAEEQAARARTGAAKLPFREWLKEYPPAPNYLWGRHTEAVAAKLQEISDNLKAGRSSYVIITIPPRHGKSDLASRSFPAWGLLDSPEWEFILATYAADLSEGLSRVARQRFQECAPQYGLRLSDELNQAGAWSLAGHRGVLYAVGLGGAITGRGAHVLIVDDYCKGREEAESETIRDRVWEGFRSDLMTRLAPVHAVVIVATRWHEDDLVGRIRKEAAANPDFPRFEELHFAAQDEQTGAYLFPERFPEAWYRAQKAALGNYAWQSLFQGNPVARTGNLLRADQVRIEDAGARASAPAGLRRIWGWDLASTAAERLKADPDYTVGTLVGWDRGSETLYVLEVLRGQWEAPERDRRIVAAALRTPGVPLRIEAVAGYKDTATRIKALLRGKAIVTAAQARGEKVARWELLEPFFEAGRVCLVRAPWNDAWLSEIGAVPRAKHDDQADSLCIAVEGAMRRPAGFSS
jgi:predicted phage terminase large subunit-like protein